MIILLGFFAALAIYHVVDTRRPSLPREETALARVVAPLRRRLAASVTHAKKRLVRWLKKPAPRSLCEQNERIIRTLRERIDERRSALVAPLRKCDHLDRAPRYCDECAGEIRVSPDFDPYLTSCDCAPAPRSLPSDGIPRSDARPQEEQLT